MGQDLNHFGPIAKPVPNCGNRIEQRLSATPTPLGFTTSLVACAVFGIAIDDSALCGSAA
ncbi:MAG: hypothetical protein ACPHUF_11835 [Gammaproteobacteria bacterium]